jgi:hypothetical protein
MLCLMPLCVIGCANSQRIDTYCRNAFLLTPTEHDRLTISDRLAAQILKHDTIFNKQCVEN